MFRSGEAHDPQLNHVVQVAIGRKHALLLTDEGIVYSWGTGPVSDSGWLGRQVSEENIQVPTPITDTFRTEGKDRSFEVIVQIACGLEHCLALSQQGKLYSWGHNKAGQLGHEGYIPGSQAKAQCKAPNLVFFKTDGNPPVVKSCSCGPESSACVTARGEVYVWGACSFFMFGEGRLYEKGDNCTIPVKIKSMPPLQERGHMPDRLAVWKNNMVCSVVNSNPNDDLLGLIELRKHRANMLSSAARHRRQEAMARGGDGADEGPELEDLRTLKADHKIQSEQLVQQIEEMKAKLAINNEELRRVTRELTICDQQDTAYNENASALEVKRSETAGKQQHVHNIDSQLNDISQFKASNRRNKVEYLAQRDKLEQENWKLQQELNASNQLKSQADARYRLLRALQKGDVGKGGGATVDDGLRIASSKREELAATYPETLSGVGKFNGFREVLQISERALQDVSSALKEVSAAAAGGDGAVLEEVLEANLKLRKELNMLIVDKLAHVDEGTGLLQTFWSELKSSGPAEESSQQAIGMGNFGGMGGFAMV
jgi:hypothetical protein